MSPETKTAERPRMAALSPDFGRKLVELATGHGVSVADYCDSELAEIINENWRAMMQAKLDGKPLPPLKSATKDNAE